MSALAVLPVTAGGSYHAMVTLTIGNDDTWIDDEMRDDSRDGDDHVISISIM